MTSKKRIRKLRKFSVMMPILVMLGVFLALLPAKIVNAAGNVRFGSASYAPQAGTDFQVGIYVEPTDENLIGDYSLTIGYDINMISFVDGAIPTEDGQLVVSGVAAEGKQGMHMLTFHALDNVGDTSVSCISAAVNDMSGNPMEIVGLPVAPISIQQAVTKMPEYLRVNDKEVAGLTEGQTEYTFSVPYAESFAVEAPEGYQVNFEAPATPQVGRNNITVVLTQPNANPLTLQLHVNMEPKEEEPVEEPSEEASEVTVEFITPSDSEVASEIVSEEIPSEPEPVSEQVEIPGGKTTREGGFPPNNQIHYEFKKSDLIFIGGCVLGAVILGLIIMLIVNGRSVGDEEEEDEDDDEEWYDEDENEDVRKSSKKEKSGFAYAEEDFTPKKSAKKDSEKAPKKDADKESDKDSEETKMGDAILAATYKKDSKDAVGDEIVAATYKKKDTAKDQEEADEADEAENKRLAKEEKARLKEERRAEKEAAKEEQARAKEEREAEKEARAKEKEERVREKEERIAAKEAAKEEKEAAREVAREEKEAAKAEKEAAKEEQARIKEEREAEKEARAKEKEKRLAQKEAEREARMREKEERARAKEAAKETAKETAKEQRLYVDDATGQLVFLPLDYSEEDLEKFTNEDDEDNIVGNAELVRSEEIADFDDDVQFIPKPLNDADDVEIDESAVVAATLAAVGGAEAVSNVAESTAEGNRGYEEYEPDDDDEEFPDEDEDGFIDIESIVSDRRPKI